MTEQATSTPPSLIRLHHASVVLQLLATHPELAAAPIDWEINDRDSGLWARVKYGIPESESAARKLAAALNAKVIVDDVSGRPLYSVYGTWHGTEVNLQAFGPAASDTAEAVTA
ncbi:hypothetical protein [Streptomyces sp. NPDC050388]|uniref:hypothetical protein n=1 Tax=Streptomyces sp. NPDC050388 TaxID=3155781 RepID=UPI00342E01D7